MNIVARDMTPTVNLTRERGPGAVRHRRPIYVDLLPPCNAACPAGSRRPRPRARFSTVQVAMGANSQQTLDAFREAEAYDGPSLILAYSPCIAHGIDMRFGMKQQDLAVAAATGHCCASIQPCEASARARSSSTRHARPSPSRITLTTRSAIPPWRDHFPMKPRCFSPARRQR
jgi:hypothetical protein